jgi:cation transporter-like permease
MKPGAMETASSGDTSSRWTTFALAAAACTTLVALLSVFGLAEVLEGAKVVLVLLFVLMCLTLAVFALLVAVSSLLPLRRRGFGDWL